MRRGFWPTARPYIAKLCGLCLSNTPPSFGGKHSSSNLRSLPSARNNRARLSSDQHLSIIDSHFKPISSQRRQLDQPAAGYVVTPTALPATDMRAGHQAQCKRSAAANAEVTERVKSAIEVEQGNRRSVDGDYGCLSIVRL